MTQQTVAAIVLAAGQGTRMKSDLHKVLHPIAGQPMLHHVLDSVDAIGAARQVVIVGARAEQIEDSLTGRKGVEIVHQAEQLGTGHAVAQAETTLKDFSNLVLVLYGDVPLITPATLKHMVETLSADPECRSVVLAFRPDDPGAYGRVVTEADGVIHKMVEAKDASDEELAVNLCNTGLLLARAPELFELLKQVGNDNAAGEYYLPDIVMLPGGRSRAIEVDAWEATGVNSRSELALAERYWQQRKRSDAMAEGASLIDPDTVWFSYDTKIGRDVVIEPHVVFGPGVAVGDGATILGFSHITGASIGRGCSVGPFARLRPGAVMEDGAKVGNFVEMKKAVLGKGAKASHLSYLGDATVGAGANIGAGTITCNYDGWFKYHTEIGDGAFIGSNSSLIAPVKIGKGAIVGAGSAVSKDVPDGALGLVRAPQDEKPGWANRFNAAMKNKKGRK